MFGDFVNVWSNAYNGTDYPVFQYQNSTIESSVVRDVVEEEEASSSSGSSASTIRIGEIDREVLLAN